MSGPLYPLVMDFLLPQSIGHMSLAFGSNRSQSHEPIESQQEAIHDDANTFIPVFTREFTAAA